ncbi:MAG: hypothetical protein NZ602_02510 [Thermoguttaceae bacterium]|nr:hypothetical protein [Thermoguttaceae bacterium]MDW8039651.1 hypothetical protein [Thermoguttaceae bacterium]
MSAGIAFPAGFRPFYRAQNTPSGGCGHPPINNSGAPSVPLDNLHPASLDQNLLDRLVDGELSEAEQRQLLHQVQNHPDGWRQLALAFLEAQTWRQEMPFLVPGASAFSKPPMPRTEQPGLGAPSTHRPRRIPIGAIVTLAGGLLVAFLGGYLLRDSALRLGNKAPTGFVVQGGSADRGGEQGGDGFQVPGQKEVLEPLESFPSFGWEYVTLAADTGPDGIPEVVRLPVFSPPSRSSSSTIPTSIPEEILQILRRWGAEVSHSWYFVPLRMENGYQVILPVEQVELSYPHRGERYQ